MQVILFPNRFDLISPNYLFSQRETETERDRETETDRETDKDRETDTERQIQSLFKIWFFVDLIFCFGLCLFI